MTTTDVDSPKAAIYWFRNALRFHDNPSFKRACDDSQTLIPLYVIDPNEPFAQTSGVRPECIRANFVLESIREVDNKLRAMRVKSTDEVSTEGMSRMIIIKGKPEDVIPKVVAAMSVTSLYYEQEAAEPVRLTDRKVFAAIDKLVTASKPSSQCKVHGFPTHTLHPMELYLSKCKGNVAPSSYGAFTKLFQSLRIADEVPTISEVPPLPKQTVTILNQLFNSNLDIPTLEEIGYENSNSKLQHRKKGGIDFNGGEDAALALLTFMMNRAQWVATFEKPKTSPNALKVDTTGLSPYVKHGCLSPRRFYNELSKVYAKFNPKNISKPPVSLHGQLMWREYNYLMGYSTPNFDKMVDNPVARQIPWDDNPDILAAWENSKTGYPFIDAIMTQLRETGWIHHLARHAVACFLTRGDLWQSWEKGANIFERYLIDADWSINNFNWQWLSCTAHFYQYFRCYSPVAFGKKTDPNGDYIRKWLPQFKNMPAKFIYEPWEAPIAVQQKCGVIIGKTYPRPIVDHKVVSKLNMSRIQQAYEAQKLGNPMPVLPVIRDSTEQSEDVTSSKKRKV